MNNRNVSYLLIGLALAALSALLRFWAFTQTPFANGWDSYFYLVQLKSLEETSRMHSPEASLIYPYLRLFYWLTGDYVLGMKVGVAALCGIWVGALYFFPPYHGVRWPALVALFSPQLTYFAAQYPKNLLGLLLLWLFIWSVDQQKSRRLVWVAPAVLLVLNYFGHRMTFGLALLYLVVYLAVHLRTFISADILKKALFAGAAVLGLFLLAGYFLPGLAHVADMGRLQGIISAMPQFAPWSFVQTFGFQRISACWLFEIGAVTALFLWNVFVFFRQKNHAALPLLLLCAVLIFPFLEWSTTGIAWRFWMVFILLVPVACLSRIRVPGGEIGVACCYLLLLGGSFFSWKSYQPALHDPDYVQFQRITERVQQYFNEASAPKSPGRVERPDDLARGPELVIAHNALAEYFTFSTGTDAMPWLPEYAIDSSWLWRIAAGVRLPTLQYFSGEENAGKIKNLGGNYYLMPEYVWQQAVVKARTEQDADFLEVVESWRNPWKMRPGWLLRRH